MRFLKKFTAIALALALAIPLCPLSAAASTPNNVLRVGLKYGSSVVSAYNMLCDSGFELGFYNSANVFTVEARIRSTYISAARDVPLKISGNTVTASSDSPTIKPYHLQVNRTFDSQNSAEEFISSAKSAGYKGMIFVAYINGVFLVRFDEFSSAQVASTKVAEYSAYTGGASLTAVGNEVKTITFIDLGTKSIVFEFEPKSGYPAIRGVIKSKSLMADAAQPSSPIAQSPSYLTESVEAAEPSAPVEPNTEAAEPSAPVEPDPNTPVAGVEGEVPEGSGETVAPPPTEEIVAPIVSEAVAYIKNGSYYYSGGFEFRRSGDSKTSVINFVNLEEYVKSVVPFEMTNSWPLEALKAQAVCARTYALTNISRHKSDSFNVCNSVHCQVYYGNSRENENVRQAVAQTHGQVVTYNGGMIATYYYSSSGGYTESNDNAWGGSPKPYYAAVPDPYEPQDKIVTFSNFYTLADLTEIARGLGANIGTVTDCYVSKYTEPAGNVYEVTFEGTGGIYTISETDRVRIRLSKLVKSPRFKINVVPLLLVNTTLTSLDLPIAEMFAITGTGETMGLSSKASDVTVLTATGSYNIDTSNLVYNFKGSGWGHNVGMSQWGAHGMALAGFTYDQILKHYYTGVDLTVMN